MTKEQYRAAGAAACAAGNPPAALMRNKGTWQALAYMGGYDGARREQASRDIADQRPEWVGSEIAISHAGRGSGKALKRVPVSGIDEMTAFWPVPAREHARRLALDMNGERKPERNLRLFRALQRMHKRHGRHQRIEPYVFLGEAADIPLSTQPHPDGPITVGQVLRGL